MKQWYEKLFENYANQYENESFTKGTLGEVDFMEKEVNYDKAIKILDVGCGTGRHTLEFTRRGYDITGLDLSEGMLSKARKMAKAEKLNVEYIRKDARKFEFPDEFDLVIMICEGAFSLMETDEMNYQILKNVYTSLRRNGKFIFTTINGLYTLFHSDHKLITRNTSKNDPSETYFDLITFREHSTFHYEDDKGNKQSLQCIERHYVPSEITWLLKSLGFEKNEMFGCKLGAFSRNDKLTTKDFEMLVIAEK